MPKKSEKTLDKSSVRFKYSKPSLFYLKSKHEYFVCNDKLLAIELGRNEIYKKQPLRRFCKLCQVKLPQNIDFNSHGIDYIFCENCEHLNGKYEDTLDFVNQIYIDVDGQNYAHDYIDKDFSRRTSDIYLPKVDFLIDSIGRESFKLLDVGCGGGYFVLASIIRNIKALGLDINKTMVEFGNFQIYNLKKVNPLIFVAEDEFYKKIIESDVDVISMIGVIEHLREPHKLFDAFKKSSARYLYYSVPMFSFSAVLENIFKNVYPRQLSGGHTHLFTEQSIKKMNSLMDVVPIAEWRFGTDILDLYRHILININANKASIRMLNYLNEGFEKNIDDIQEILDKNHFCSEIHLIASKK